MSTSIPISEMVAAPGIYWVGIPGEPHLARVEVEANGTVHQLTFDMGRDGVLNSDGWHKDARAVRIEP